MSEKSVLISYSLLTEQTTELSAVPMLRGRDVLGLLLLDDNPGGTADAYIVTSLGHYDCAKGEKGIPSAQNQSSVARTDKGWSSVGGRESVVCPHQHDLQ